MSQDRNTQNGDRVERNLLKLAEKMYTPIATFITVGIDMSNDCVYRAVVRNLQASISANSPMTEPCSRLKIQRL